MRESLSELPEFSGMKNFQNRERMRNDSESGGADDRCGFALTGCGSLDQRHESPGERRAQLPAEHAFCRSKGHLIRAKVTFVEGLSPMDR